jgi:AcrR family transcriptional regulator
VVIVEAVLQAVRELPLEASMKDIARRAGVGIASLYRYFPGREALYAELGRQLLLQLLDASRDHLSAANTLEEAIDACCEMGLSMGFGASHVVRAVHERVPFNWQGEVAMAVNAELLASIAQTMARFVIATPEQLHTRSFLTMTLLRGASRGRMLLTELAPTADQARSPMQAALLACILDGVVRRPTPLPFRGNWSAPPTTT